MAITKQSRLMLRLYGAVLFGIIIGWAAIYFDLVFG